MCCLKIGVCRKYKTLEERENCKETSCFYHQYISPDHNDEMSSYRIMKKIEKIMKKVKKGCLQA